MIGMRQAKAVLSGSIVGGNPSVVYQRVGSIGIGRGFTRAIGGRFHGLSYVTTRHESAIKILAHVRTLPECRRPVRFLVKGRLSHTTT